MCHMHTYILLDLQLPNKVPPMLRMEKNKWPTMNSVIVKNILKLMISLIPISYKTAFIEQLLHFSYIASLYYQSRNARFCQHCESLSIPKATCTCTCTCTNCQRICSLTLKVITIVVNQQMSLKRS